MQGLIVWLPCPCPAQYLIQDYVPQLVGTTISTKYKTFSFGYTEEII